MYNTYPTYTLHIPYIYPTYTLHMRELSPVTAPARPDPTYTLHIPYIYPTYIHTSGTTRRHPAQHVPDFQSCNRSRPGVSSSYTHHVYTCRIPALRVAPSTHKECTGRTPTSTYVYTAIPYPWCAVRICWAVPQIHQHIDRWYWYLLTVAPVLSIHAYPYSGKRFINRRTPPPPHVHRHVCGSVCADT